MPEAKTRKKRSSPAKALVKVALVILLLLACLLALAPTLLGGPVRGVIAGILDDSIAGDVEIGSVSLSWFGPQRIDGITVREAGVGPSAAPLAVVDIRADASIASILSSNLGVITVSGEATATRDADGRIDLIDAITSVAVSDAPADASATADPVALDPGLAATVRLAGVSVELIDDSAALIPNITGLSVDLKDARVELAGGDATLSDLDGEVTYSAAGDTARTRALTLGAEATIANLFDAAGTLDPASATIEASATTGGDAASLADAILAAGGSLALLFDRDVTSTLDVTGPLLKPTLTANAQTGPASLDAAFEGAFNYDPSPPPGVSPVTGDLRGGDRPIVLTIDTGRLAQAIADATGDDAEETRATLGEYPTVTLTLTELRLALGPNGPNLAESGLEATLTTTPLNVTLAADDAEAEAGVEAGGEAGDDVALLLPEFQATVSAGNMSSAITARIERTAFSMDGAAAGSFQADLTLRDLFTPDGRIALDPLPTLTGSAGVSELKPAVVQPLVDLLLRNFDLNIADTLGDEQISFTLDAVPFAGSEAGSTADTRVAISLESQRLAASGAVISSGSTVRSLPGDDIAITARDLTPLLTALARQAGAPVEFTSASEARGLVTDLFFDFKPMLDGSLAGLRLAAELEPANAAFGVLASEGVVADALSREIRDLTLAVNVGSDPADPAAPEIRITAGGDAFLDGAPAGTLAAELTADDVLAGLNELALAPILGALAGTVDLDALDSGFFRPFFPNGVELAELLGERVTANAAVTPAHAERSLAGEPTSVVSLSIESDAITGGGEILASLAELSIPSPGLTLKHTRPGAAAEAIGRLAGAWPEDAILEEAGTLDIALTEVSVDLARVTEGLAAATGRATLTLGGVEVSLPDTGVVDGAMAGDQRLAANDAEIVFTLAGGPVPSVEATIDVAADTSTVEGGAVVTLTSDYDDAADTLTLSLDGSKATLNDLALAGAKTDGEAVRIRPSAALLIGAITLANASTAIAGGEGSVAVDLALGVRELGASGPELAAVAVDLDAALAGLAPAGSFTGSVTLDRVDTAYADALLGLDETFRGALGPRFRAVLDEVAIVFADSNTNADGDAGQAGGSALAFDSLTARLRLESGAIARRGAPVENARLETTSPAELTVDEDGARLDRPLIVSLLADAAWLSGFVEGDDPAAPTAVVLGDVPVSLEVAELTLPAAGSGGRPALDARFAIDPAAIQTAEGTLQIDSGEITLATVDAQPRAETGPDAPATAALRELVINASILTTPPGAANNAEQTRLLTIDDGRVVGLFDETGAFTPDAITADMDVVLKGLPVPIVDTALNMSGYLAGVLGDSADFTFAARGFPQQRGTLELTGGGTNATIERCRLTVARGVLPGGVADDSGTRRDLAIRPGEDIVIRLSGFSSDVGDGIASVLPAFGEITKVPGRDRPGSVTVSRLRIPFLGYPIPPAPEEGRPADPTEAPADDLFIRGRRMVAEIDLGEVRYGLGGELSQFLNTQLAQRFGALADMQDNKSALPAFRITMADGELSYSQLFVPIGEFTFEASGSLSMLGDDQDHTMLLPFGALAVEAFNSPSLQRILGDVPDGFEIPLRLTDAPDGSLAASLDTQAMVSEFLQPQNLLEQGLRIFDNATRDD